MCRLPIGVGLWDMCGIPIGGGLWDSRCRLAMGVG